MKSSFERPDGDVARPYDMLRDELVQPTNTLNAVRHTNLAEDRSGLVDDARVVMGLRPIDPNEDHHASFLLDDNG